MLAGLCETLEYNDADDAFELGAVLAGMESAEMSILSPLSGH